MYIIVCARQYLITHPHKYTNTPKYTHACRWNVLGIIIVKEQSSK